MAVQGFGSAVSDLTGSQRRWDEAAGRVARAATGDEDLLAATAELMTARRGYEATLAVVRSRDRMLGTLIDMLA